MIYKNKITDLFFDLDHTLWDFEKNSELTFKQLVTLIKTPIYFFQLVAMVRYFAPFNM